MANQFRFFIGKNKEELDHIEVKSGQMLKDNATGDLYQDITIDGQIERVKVQFIGDWDENNSTSDSYIKNRTHWYSDPLNKIVGQKLPMEFLPDGVKVYPAIVESFQAALDAAESAEATNVISKSGYYIGQQILVLNDEKNNNTTRWYYIKPGGSLGGIAGEVNIGDLDLSQYVAKSEVITSWNVEVTKDNENLPISYGVVKDVVGAIEIGLKNI